MMTAENERDTKEADVRADDVRSYRIRRRKGSSVLVVLRHLEVK